jgi:CBS domain-containing protein
LTQDDLLQPETRAARSIMTDPISALGMHSLECIPCGTSLAEAIARMQATNKGYVCVTNPDGSLAGIFTEREIIAHVAGRLTDLSAVTVDSLMTRPVTTLEASVPVAHALHLMAVHGFRHLPLVDDAGRPAGMLSSRHIVQFIEAIA